MILGIDAHNVRGNGGSVIHLKELLAASAPDEHNLEKLIVWVNKELIDKLPQREFVKYIILPRKNSLKSLVWQLFKLKQEAIKEKCDLLFFPGGIYVGKFKPFVAFAQSPFPFDYKVWKIYFPSKQTLVFAIKKLLMLHTFRKAEGVIFVSDSIKKRVEKFNKKIIPNSKVIHHGVSDIFANKVPRRNLSEIKKQGLQIKLLTVSSHSKHKNLKYLVKVVSELNEEGHNFVLKIVGPETKYGTNDLLKLVKKVDPNNSFVQMFSNENYEDIPKFYNEADIFAIPSLCESFGLPFREAIENNIPILYQKLDPFNEILETVTKSPTYIEFDYYKNNLKGKFLELLNKKSDEKYSDETEYDLGWDKCTKETYKFIRRIAES